MNANVIGVAGWKNSGKTTLVIKLVGELRNRGFKVATVKHAHHDFDIDREGKDSYRHRTAGASEVAIVSARRWALIGEVENPAAEPTLDEILRRMSPVDVTVVEGFKGEAIPKIEVRRKAAVRSDPLLGDVPNVIAVATDSPCESRTCPAFDLDDAAGIADLVLAHLGLRQPELAPS